MKDHQVDADQICKHIKYTQHWLDKANQDFEEQNFANGGVVLNIARAELTAAWEEAMQLKTQVFTTLPRKARANWKPLTSVGALASGFLIAFVMMKVMPDVVPGGSNTPAPETVQVVAPAAPEVEDARSASLEESAASLLVEKESQESDQVKAPETAGEAAQPAEPIAVEKSLEAAAVEPVDEPAPAVRRSSPPTQATAVPAPQESAAASKTAPAQQNAQTTIAPKQQPAKQKTEPAHRETAATKQKTETPARNVMNEYRTAPLPYSPVAGRSSSSKTGRADEKTNTGKLDQEEVIDLYRTAEQALEDM